MVAEVEKIYIFLQPRSTCWENIKIFLEITTVLLWEGYIIRALKYHPLEFFFITTILLKSVYISREVDSNVSYPTSIVTWSLFFSLILIYFVFLSLGSTVILIFRSEIIPYLYYGKEKSLYWLQFLSKRE